jgi:hypothetical protein
MNFIVKLFQDILVWGLEKHGRYYSKYRAWVSDREDPQHLGRLKLVVPNISGDDEIAYWAWPSRNFSGPGYGNQVLPRKNDLVWVEFEHGDPRKPIWSYGHFTKGQKPNNLKDYNNYWFRTPSGHQVELHDDGYIKVTTSGGHTLLFDDTNKSIKIESIGGKQFEISDDKIHLGQFDGADEAAALGDTLKEKLDDLFNNLSNLIDELAASKIMTQLGPQTFMPTDIIILNARKISLEGLKATLSQILSQTITLDK